jgi:parallel beta-helix repeat protein
VPVTRASLSALTASGNDAHGIDIDGDDNKLSGNVANGNGIFGINLDAEAPAGGNRLSRNETNANGDTGIRVAPGSTGNRISGNESQGNLGWDLEDENPGCADNAWSRSLFITANEACIE